MTHDDMNARVNWKFSLTILWKIFFSEHHFSQYCVENYVFWTKPEYQKSNEKPYLRDLICMFCWKVGQPSSHDAL